MINITLICLLALMALSFFIKTDKRYTYIIGLLVSITLTVKTFLQGNPFLGTIMILVFGWYIYKERDVFAVICHKQAAQQAP